MYCNLSLSKVAGEPVSSKAECDCDHFETNMLLAAPDFCCEAEASCRVKLASTKGRTRGCSDVDLGLQMTSEGKLLLMLEG